MRKILSKKPVSKNLRVIKAREKDVTVENDLRGLGQTTLFADLKPVPVLKLSGKVSSEDSLLSELGLAIREQSDTIAEVECVLGGSCHKEKALRLFAFAMHQRRKHGLQGCLVETSPYRKALAEGLSIPLEDVEPAYFSVGISVDVAIQYHLRQAGLGIEPQESTQVLSDDKLNGLFEQMTSTNQSAKTHKIGAA